MSATCLLAGRLGNIFFHITTMLAYCKKHGLGYHIPDEAPAYKHGRNPLSIPSTSDAPVTPTIYKEPNMSDGSPCWHEIPFIENVMFEGYFQSFKYIDWCRDYILDTLNIPYKFEKGIVSISVRRGDCIGSTAFPPAPQQYYKKAVAYMEEKGYDRFRVYSDDIDWCKREFTVANYPNSTFEFSEGDEWSDYVSMSGCEHNITARSTFSLTAAWLNRNPNKIVLVPKAEGWWRGQNKDLIPDYFTQIFFKDVDDSNMGVYEMEYDGFTFGLMIKDYWSTIYRGQSKEKLYGDYCLMIDEVKKANKEKYVLDIGANHGLFSVPISKLGYKVVGFEPVSTNIYSLVMARDMNDLKKFDMFHMALSDKNGEIEIYIPECHDNASLSKDAAVSNMVGKDYKVEKVDTARFDDWIKDHVAYKDIGFIKIDAQGSEYMILDGMRDYLTSNNDIYLVCEYEHHLNTMGHTFEELDNLILSYGFQFQKQLTPSDKLFYKP